jgi:hypothetical protein
VIIECSTIPKQFWSFTKILNRCWHKLLYGMWKNPKVTWKSPLSAKFLGHFSPIVPPSAAGFASVASDVGGLLWRKLERSKSLVLLQVGGLSCHWQRHFVKPFLLRMLNDNWAGRNPTKGCSADWRRRSIFINSKYLDIAVLFSGANFILTIWWE